MGYVDDTSVPDALYNYIAHRSMIALEHAVWYTVRAIHSELNVYDIQ